MTLLEIHLSPEMIAAGMEALKEARTECFSEAEAIIDIYLAMRGAEIKCLCEGEEPVH